VHRPAVLICPKCQARIPASAKFCPEYGADLRQSTSKKHKPNHTKSTRKTLEAPNFEFVRVKPRQTTISAVSQRRFRSQLILEKV
jgi:ribosomal protein L40E